MSVIWASFWSLWLEAILTGCCAGVLRCTAGGPISFTLAAMERTTLLPLYGRIQTSLADTLIFHGVRNWLPYSVADVGEGPGGPDPLIFRPNWGLKGRKKRAAGIVHDTHFKQASQVMSCLLPATSLAIPVLSLILSLNFRITVCSLLLLLASL